MSWSTKTKNAEATTTLKTKNAIPDTFKKSKIATQSDTLYILTPNGDYILVGSAEDETLIYRAGFDNWSLKTRIES